MYRHRCVERSGGQTSFRLAVRGARGLGVIVHMGINQRGVKTYHLRIIREATSATISGGRKKRMLSKRRWWRSAVGVIGRAWRRWKMSGNDENRRAGIGMGRRKIGEARYLMARRYGANNNRRPRGQ